MVAGLLFQLYHSMTMAAALLLPLYRSMTMAAHPLLRLESKSGRSENADLSIGLPFERDQRIGVKTFLNELDLKPCHTLRNVILCHL